MAEDIISYVYSEKNVGENRIIIPGNLYLWATLNSTDDGVSPMDSAFKRRWSSEHISNDPERLIRYLIGQFRRPL